MNGKLREIALGMSVLMCAGMLFTCVMPAKARFKVCDHSTYALLGWTEEYLDVTSYDDYGHNFRRDERGACGICGEEFVLQTEIVRSEEHYIIIEFDKQTGHVEKRCNKCNYEDSYYIIIIQ